MSSMLERKVGGRYQIVELIGAGGMGRVFRAIDTETGESVATKILSVSDEVTLDMLLRFQQEGAVLATLEHANIVEVYGTFLEKHASCIVMELVEGRPLSDILRSERLSLGRVSHLALQVASALAYAHSRAIVHRDIKPQNIVVMANDHIKVTDFGIARVMREGSTLSTVTGMTLGTPLYMAPEQIESHKVDGRADIYSMGALLYHMVTGRPPFEGRDPLSLAFKHVHRAPQPPSTIDASVPQDWEALILKALAKDPAKRFQSAVALGEAIASLRTEPIAQVHPTAPRSPSVPSTPVDIGTIDESPVKPERPQEWTTEEGFAHMPLADAPTERPAVQPQQGPSQIAATPVGVASVRGEEMKRPLPWLPVVGGLVALSAVLVAAFIVVKDGGSKHAGPTPTARPVAVVPFLVPTTHVHAVSGQKVALRWVPTPKATAYRLQIATWRSDPSDAVVFKHPHTTITTTKTSYSLQVVGHQYYYWRVGAEVGGKWYPYSHSQHFSVARPAIGKVWLLSPRNGTRTTATQMHLCWTKVKGAHDYTLQVSGSATQRVRGTCSWISVRPGTYRWRVAARVKGVYVYTGPYSARASFAIQKPVAKPKPTPTPVPQQPTPASTRYVAPTPVPTAYVAPTTAPYVAPTQAPTAYVAPTTAPYVAPTQAPAQATATVKPTCNPEAQAC